MAEEHVDADALVAPGAPEQVLTAEQLHRTVGVSYCPVPGCQRKPEGFKSAQALKFHLQSHGAAGEALLDAPPPAVVLPVLPSAPGGPRVPVPSVGPFHCPVADCPFGPGKKALKSLKTATQHAKKHAAPGAETFTCERCQRGFTLRYRLTEHSKTCGKKPFHCKCGLALGHKSSLKTHIAQWNKTAPGEHADATPADDGGAAGDEAVAAGGAAGDADGDAELHEAVLAAQGDDGDADGTGLNM